MINYDPVLLLMEQMIDESRQLTYKNTSVAGSGQ